MDTRIKKITATLLGLGLSVFAISVSANTYLNTSSFGTVQGDVGYGQLAGETATPWSVGAGYQWVISDQLTLGLEADYFDNGSITQNQTDVTSQAVVPFVSLYYYITPHINLFGKIGYGYQQSKYTELGTTESNTGFQPAGVGGIGYLIPFSKMAYLNAFIDASWIDQNNDIAANYVSNSGVVIKNMQCKVGLQLMF